MAGHRVGGERTKNRDKIILKMFGGERGGRTQNRDENSLKMFWGGVHIIYMCARVLYACGATRIDI